MIAEAPGYLSPYFTDYNVVISVSSTESVAQDFESIRDKVNLMVLLLFIIIFNILVIGQSRFRD